MQPDSACRCDAGWRADDCSSVAVKQSRIVYPSPAKPPVRGSNGTTAGWGSTVARDDEGVYNMFTDVVCQEWIPAHELNANIEHSTSTTGPVGPWIGQGVVLGHAVNGQHQPSIERAPFGTWLLFHESLSPGTQDSSTPSNCTGQRGDASGHVFASLYDGR
eukprot:SAG11_NODE_788_length_7169_cov_1.889109_5_plen_161_part_00